GTHRNATSLTKNIIPPRVFGRRSQSRASFFEGVVPGLLWGAAQFSMLFHLIVMFAEKVKHRVGRTDFTGALSLEKGRQALLPELMTAFNFSFGLRRRGKAHGDTVKVQGR